MRAPMPNQALEPTETRVSVLDVAALTSPMVSGLGGSVLRYVWELKATRLAPEENEPRLS